MRKFFWWVFIFIFLHRGSTSAMDNALCKKFDQKAFNKSLSSYNEYLQDVRANLARYQCIITADILNYCFLEASVSSSEKICFYSKEEKFTFPLSDEQQDVLVDSQLTIYKQHSEIMEILKLLLSIEKKQLKNLTNFRKTLRALDGLCRELLELVEQFYSEDVEDVQESLTLIRDYCCAMRVVL